MATASTPTFESVELDRTIAEAEESAVVLWRGEPLPFRSLPERIGQIPDRDERDRLYTGYREALQALNPLYERRLAAWSAEGDVAEIAARQGPDPRALAVDVERFVVISETPYFAALRRYLALIDIEQGDATLADLWRVVRGTAWSHWFDRRSVERAVSATGRPVSDEIAAEGWRAAERALQGASTASPAARAVAAAYASLSGSAEWLTSELGVVEDEVVPLVDFVTFVRLWRLRRDVGRLQYELRLFAGTTDEGALRRAYYAGIVGHITGVIVPEEAYLHEVPAPFASAQDVEVAMMAGQLIEALERAHGPTWWRAAAAHEQIAAFAEAPTVEDALAPLGYDSPDWRPVLRQIRTRLIGEMSGYGGPNITTRAGTRKV